MAQIAKASITLNELNALFSHGRLFSALTDTLCCSCFLTVNVSIIYELSYIMFAALDKIYVCI